MSVYLFKDPNKKDDAYYFDKTRSRSMEDLRTLLQALSRRLSKYEWKNSPITWRARHITTRILMERFKNERE